MEEKTASREWDCDSDEGTHPSCTWEPYGSLISTPLLESIKKLLATDTMTTFPSEVMDIIVSFVSSIPLQSSIIHLGSMFITSGFAANIDPSSIDVSVVAKPNRFHSGMMQTNPYYCVGQSMYNIRRSRYDFVYPMLYGALQLDINDSLNMIIKLLINVIQNELRSTMDTNGCIVVISPLFNRHKSLTHSLDTLRMSIFKHIKCPALSFQFDVNMALHSVNSRTGLVINMGHTATVVCAIVDNQIISQQCSKLISGRYMSAYLCYLLRKRGYKYYTRAEFEILRDMKEKLCFIQSTQYIPQNDFYLTNYEMPDGEIIKVNCERYQITELIFKPLECLTTIDDISIFDDDTRSIQDLDLKDFISTISILRNTDSNMDISRSDDNSIFGFSNKSLTHLIVDSLLNIDCDRENMNELWQSLLSNIVLCGGSSMFKGLEQRLTIELQNCETIKRINPKMKFQFNTDIDRKYGCWKGAAIYAKQKTFANEWIQRPIDTKSD